MACVHGQVVAHREFGRLAGYRDALHVYGALQGILRRHLPASGHGPAQFDVLLLAGDGPRERDPGTHGLAGRHRVGVDHQGLGHPHPSREHAGGAIACGGQDLGVVGMQALIGPGRERRHRRRTARGGLGADPVQVGDGAVEVATLAVDVQVLDQAGGIPGVEFGLLQVRDRLPQPGQHRATVEAEVQADAAHALAFECQRLARFIA